MDVSQPNSKFQNDLLLDALMPIGLLFIRKGLDKLDEHQRKDLLLDMYGPGDLDLRRSASAT